MSRRRTDTLLLLSGAITGICVGLLRGGSIIGLRRIRFLLGWAAILALLIQVLIVYLPVGLLLNLGNRALGMMLSFFLLPVMLIANLRLKGVKLLLSGLLSNLLVMAANSGFMPVTPEALSQSGLNLLSSRWKQGRRNEGVKYFRLP